MVKLLSSGAWAAASSGPSVDKGHTVPMVVLTERTGVIGIVRRTGGKYLQLSTIQQDTEQ